MTIHLRPLRAKKYTPAERKELERKVADTRRELGFDQMDRDERKSTRLTAEDYAITINCRGYTSN